MTDYEYVTHEIGPISLVSQVLKRPRLYTENGSLTEIFAFLEGVQTGLLLHGPFSLGADTEVPLIQTWLAESIGLAPGSVVKAEQLIQKFGSEQDVFKSALEFISNHTSNEAIEE